MFLLLFRQSIVSVAVCLLSTGLERWKVFGLNTLRRRQILPETAWRPTFQLSNTVCTTFADELRKRAIDGMEILIENWAIFPKFVCEQNYTVAILRIEPIHDLSVSLTSRMFVFSYPRTLAFSQAGRTACRCAVRSALRYAILHWVLLISDVLRLGLCIRLCCWWKFVDLMNIGCKVLIFKVMSSQHFLNKPLTKREINNCGLPVSQLSFWLVEILLRGYIAYYQYIY